MDQTSFKERERIAAEYRERQAEIACAEVQREMARVIEQQTKAIEREQEYKSRLARQQQIGSQIGSLMSIAALGAGGLAAGSVVSLGAANSTPDRKPRRWAKHFRSPYQRKQA